MDRLAYFGRLVEEDPTVARARFAYANELLRAERWEEAVVQLREGDQIPIFQGLEADL